jgi:hypothetical protein
VCILNVGSNWKLAASFTCCPLYLWVKTSQYPSERRLTGPQRWCRSIKLNVGRYMALVAGSTMISHVRRNLLVFFKMDFEEILYKSFLHIIY